jgi:hypothetical protein
LPATINGSSSEDMCSEPSSSTQQGGSSSSQGSSNAGAQSDQPASSSSSSSTEAAACFNYRFSPAPPVPVQQYNPPPHPVSVLRIGNIVLTRSSLSSPFHFTATSLS